MSAKRSGAYLSGLGKFLWRSAGQCGSRHLRGNVDVVEVLIAVGWWWVLVSAKLVASTEDAGVEETGLSCVVVA